MATAGGLFAHIIAPRAARYCLDSNIISHTCDSIVLRAGVEVPHALVLLFLGDGLVSQVDFFGLFGYADHFVVKVRRVVLGETLKQDAGG